MIWRCWSWIAGIPVGLLAALVTGALQPVGLVACAAGAGVALLLLVSWIARARDDDPARGAHLAAAASTGLAALPVLAAAPLHLGPGPGVWLGILLALLAVTLRRAARLRGPSGGIARQLGAVVLWPAVSGVAVFALAAALAGAGSDVAGIRAEEVYEIDARVPTRAIPVCAATPPRITVLLDRGAHARLDPEAQGLWFDAAVPTGARQVHRLDVVTGEVRCWTCDEPGDNVRPYPGWGAIVFETDRHAHWRDPTNTEVHLLRRRADRPREPSRRLTYAPGPDGHPLLAPGSGRVVWSRRAVRGDEVVWAPVESAHGALVLGAASTLARGGAAWLAAAAWSPDARSLALVRGNPFSPLSAWSVDPSTGAQTDLGTDLVPGGVAYSADGGVVAVAGTLRRHAAGLLPIALGAALAPLANRPDRATPLHRDTFLRVGATGGALTALRVPDVEAWGEPTGLALSPDGTTLYLAQCSADGRERIVEIRRDCR